MGWASVASPSPVRIRIVLSDAPPSGEAPGGALRPRGLEAHTTSHLTREWAMTTFESVHQDEILGSLTTFDRMIFRGYLTGFFPDGAFQRFLNRRGVLLKDFGRFVEGATAKVKEHVMRLAATAGRPYVYLESAHTAASGTSKEDVAREIAERDGIKEGLVCVLAVVEPCWSFDVRRNREKKKLEVVRRRRKCLHFYLYRIDREFGWMHVRLQSWFPFTIQIYINGREQLSRRLDELGIGYARYDNCFLRIDDLAKAQELCENFAHRSLVGVFHRFARELNPWLRTIQGLGFGRYYWVLDQCEGATDVMFRDRATLEALLPDLLDHAVLSLSAEDVLRYLGRKLHGNFRGEVLTDLKKRPEGFRVKHTMKRNSVKMYDKLSVLRIETTINNPHEFKVLRVLETPAGTKRRWLPMGKGVANLWRYAQVVAQANNRYLEALARVQGKSEAIDELDRLCRCRRVDGRRFARFNPVAASDVELFKAVAAGEHLINGFRNRDVTRRLFPQPPASSEEARRRCARISRQIAKLRGHGLVAKVKNSHLYRVTARGCSIIAAVLSFHEADFPRVYSTASTACG